MLSKNSLTLLYISFLTLFLTGCPKKIVKKTPVPQQETTELEDEQEDAMESDELDLRDRDLVQIPELHAIQFDFDSSDLSNEARDVLTANADYLNKHKDLDVVVSGHCDERGTVSYNLALGQKRAMSVRNYYISLGVEANRSATLSYGKEQPLCMQSTDVCMAKNRRAETLLARKKETANKKKNLKDAESEEAKK